MSYRLTGQANSTIAEVEAANKALRRDFLGPDVEFRGAYSTVLIGNSANAGAGDAAASTVFAMRVGKPGGVVWVKRVAISAGWPAAGQATIAAFSLFPATRYIKSPTLSGTQATAFPNPHRTSMPASFFGTESGTSNLCAYGDDGAGNVSFLSGQTRTLLASRSAVFVSSRVATAGRGTVQGEMLRFRPGDQPFVLWEDEGMEIQATWTASGGAAAPAAALQMTWEEYIRRA